MKGFTLVELMIVMAIIAILAVIAIPTYDIYKRRAVRAEAEEELMNIATIQEDYFNSYRKYSTTASELEGYYGMKSVGKNFNITLGGTTASYLATAYVCYEKAGSACGAGNKDLTCTISPGMEKPSCVE